MRLAKSVLILSVLSILALAATAARAQDVSTIAPPIGQQELIKKIIQAKNKVVLVNFWASWCHPCRLEIPDLMKLRESYPEDKLLILGVSMDQDPSMLLNFALKTNFNYPIFQGKPDLVPGFGLKAVPKTVVYDQNGEQVLNHDGYIPEAMMSEVMGKLLGK